MTPIKTSLGGGDIVIVGGYLNRQMFNLVTRKEILKPGDLQGEKIGVASLAGTNAFAIRLVLKEWKIPTEAVYLLVIGGSPTRRFRAMSVILFVKRDRNPHEHLTRVPAR